MSWVRIDDAVTEHRKHLKAGPAACWLWVCGIAYCQRQLSDGFIPREAVPMLGVPRGFSRLVETLIAVGLFERAEGGYRVHHYHDYNETREEAQQRRAERHEQHVAAGQRGGFAKAAKRQPTASKPLATRQAFASEPLAPAASEPLATRQAFAVAKPSPNPNPNPNPIRKEEEEPASTSNDDVVAQVLATKKHKLGRLKPHRGYRVR